MLFQNRNSAVVFLIQIGFLLLLSLNWSIENVTFAVSEQKFQREASTTPPTSATSTADTTGGGGGGGGRQHEEEESQDVYLESMEDIEHVTYLALRNFNMTDEGLLQSSWLLSSANTIVHKQHQKLAFSATLSAASGADLKDRLALMLESFTSHLRNGHLSRLNLEDLQAIANNLNQSAESSLAREPGDEGFYDADYLAKFDSIKSEDTNNSRERHFNSTSTNLSETGARQQPGSMEAALLEHRCRLLVTIYEFELFERQKSVQQQQQQQQQQLQQQSKVEYESATPAQQQTAQQVPAAPANTKRLMQLCKLAVKCHSADELVNLLNGPWRDQQLVDSSGGSSGKLSAASSAPARSDSAQFELEADSSSLSDDKTKLFDHRLNQQQQKSSPKSLRDSMSLSLAKLCPLILFQLHDDEGLCSTRRDDRPPMITVWAFATLFVTIVSFCSLIGLSITPLLGPASNSHGVESSTSSQTSNDAPPPHHSPITQPTVRRHSRTGLPVIYHQHVNYNRQQHRACLTLFEGLAVGSLVGSALFSLIPQAFELQERESNQGFLLKALIIFFGIYLFFCSERLMRIILDTRQQRKKKKRLNHRSSNSIPLPSTTVDFVDHNQQQQQQHLLALHNHSVRQDRLKAMRMMSSTTTATNGTTKNGRKNLSGQQMQVGCIDEVGSSNLSPVSLQAAANSAAKSGKLAGSSTGRSTLRGKKTSGKKSSKLVTVCKQNEDDELVDAQVDAAADHHQLHQHIKISGYKAVMLPGEDPGEQVQVNKSRSVSFPRKRNRRKSLDESGGGERVKSSEQLQVSATGGSTVGRAQKQQQVEVNDETAALRVGGVPSMKAGGATGGGGGLRNRKRRRKTRNQLLAVKRERRKRLELLHQQQQQLFRTDFDGKPESGSSSCRQGGGFLAAHLIKPGASCELQDQIRQCYPFSDSSSDESDCHSDSFSFDQVERVLPQPMSTTTTTMSKARYLPNQQKPLICRSNEPSYLGDHHANNSYLQHQDRAEPFSQGHRVNSGEAYLHHPLANSYSGKQDISTVAWMIVLGDGLHNFIDGISIGAAFSESILSGVSISVAVICEEFPHELGDFAVLVSSGMTVRQALGYNFLSACTCYLGMAVGIILGDVNDGASYISALAAGVFLYIALVDMMGELSATLEESSRDSIAKTLKLLLLQNVGIFIGISIIFVLSFIDF